VTRRLCRLESLVWLYVVLVAALLFGTLR